jgi:hypothetical protein
MALLKNSLQQYLDNSGAPLAAGNLVFWTSGTTTVTTVYSDEALTIAQTNPYTLDASGRTIGDIYHSVALTIQLNDLNGAQIRLLEIPAPAGTASSANGTLVAESVAAMIADTTLVSGDYIHTTSYYVSIPYTETQGGGAFYHIMTAANYGLTPDENGDAFTLSNALIAVLDSDSSQPIHPGQFGGIGDGVTDDNGAVQACLTYVKGYNGEMSLLDRTWKFTSVLTIDAPMTISGEVNAIGAVGDTGGAVLLKHGTLTGIEVTTSSAPTLRDFALVGNTSNVGKGLLITAGGAIKVMRFTSSEHSLANIEYVEGNYASFQDVLVAGGAGRGFHINGASTPIMLGAKFSNVIAVGNGTMTTGIDIDTAAWITGNFRSSGCTLGMDIVDVQGCHIDMQFSDSLTLTNSSAMKGNYFYIGHDAGTFTNSMVSPELNQVEVRTDLLTSTVGALSVDEDGNVTAVGTGPHSFGATSDSAQFTIGGAYTSVSTGTTTRSLLINPTLTGSSGDTGNFSVVKLGGSLISQSDTESVSLMSQLSLSGPVITDNLGGSEVITIGTTLHIAGPPTGDAPTNLYALFIDSGNTRLDGDLIVNGVVVNNTYTVAGVPTASSYTGGTIYVSNGAAGSPVLAFSNGTNWLRCDTLAAVAAS